MFNKDRKINFSAFAQVFDRISKQRPSCISKQRSSFDREISNQSSWYFARNSYQMYPFSRWRVEL